MRCGRRLFRRRDAVHVMSRRRPRSAASRPVRSLFRSSHLPESRSSPRRRTARCSASGPTLVAGEPEPVPPSGLVRVEREHHDPACHTPHLPQPRNRVPPVVDRGDGHRDVEGLILERQALRCSGHTGCRAGRSLAPDYAASRNVRVKNGPQERRNARTPWETASSPRRSLWARQPAALLVAPVRGTLLSGLTTSSQSDHQVA